jgi:hypothetical protein
MVVVLLAIVSITSCENLEKGGVKDGKKKNNKIITDPVVQDSLFRSLEKIVNNSIAKDIAGDTLAFLFLPVQATCPACRKKTIDSISKYKDRLDENHYVIIVGGGTRSIGGYFEEQNKKMPFSKNIFYDTVGLAAHLTSTNPNIYYSVNSKVYRKVSCLPKTIREDLREFFAYLEK